MALYSRNLKDFRDKFGVVTQDLQTLTTAAEVHGRKMILDGEIVAIDEAGRPSFGRLQNAENHKDRLIYYVFDLLYIDGYDIRKLPLTRRKEILQAILPELPHVRYCDHIERNGTDFFEAAAAQQLEGIIAKKADAEYSTARRSEAWLKIKTHMRQETVICGFTEPRRSRKMFGALVLGVYEDGELTYVGHTGTGFDDKELKRMYTLLKPLETTQCPFPRKPKTNMPVTWVKPQLVCEVEFTEWTGDGHMRHPSYKGQRRDKDARDVIRESQESTKAALSHIDSAANLSAKNKKTGARKSAKSQAKMLIAAELVVGKMPEAIASARKIFGSEAPATKKKKSSVSDAEEAPTSRKATQKNAKVSAKKSEASAPSVGGRRYFDPNPAGRKGEKFVTINGYKVPVSHPSKIYWPATAQTPAYTKMDMVDYYQRMAKYILPYLKDRPFSMFRTPDGIEGEGFFQKDHKTPPPEWVRTEKVWSESNNAFINYVICDNAETLVWLATQGCIEMNPWNSRIQTPDNPDWMIIDLDPEGVTYDQVIEAALVTKDVLDLAGVPSYCKTSGATGMHIYLPLGAKYDYDIVKEFGHLVAVLVHQRIPDFTTLVRSLAKRPKKGIYLDYLQNRRGQTLAAPYCLRPKPQAPVSTPLKWSEVKPGLKPTHFTIENIEARVKKMGDLWKPVIGKGIDLLACIEKLQDAAEE